MRVRLLQTHCCVALLTFLTFAGPWDCRSALAFAGTFRSSIGSSRLGRPSVSELSTCKAYRALIEDLARKLEDLDPSSPLPRFLLDPDSSCSVQPHRQSAGRHYMILTDLAGEVTGWAWVDEEADWWHLQNVWISDEPKRARSWKPHDALRRIIPELRR